jgi:hypothetical protein
MKRIFIIIFLYIIFFGNFNKTFSNPECFGPLPEYLERCKDFYLNVTFKQDHCLPIFSFTSPPSYSKFGFKYDNQYFDFFYPDTFEEYDTAVRKWIEQFENLPSVQEYYNLISQDEGVREEERKYVMNVLPFRNCEEDTFWREKKDNIINRVKEKLKNRASLRLTPANL